MKLRTKRLTLREFTANDWRVVWTYESHPQHVRFYPWTKRHAEDPLQRRTSRKNC